MLGPCCNDCFSQVFSNFQDTNDLFFFFLNTGREIMCTMICLICLNLYGDVIMSAIASQITGVSIVFSTVCRSVNQRKHQSSWSLAFVRGIHRWPVNSPHKRPVTRRMFPFDDAMMTLTHTMVQRMLIDMSQMCQVDSFVQRWCAFYQSVSFLFKKDY